MLLAYLASAIAFYVFVARRAPVTKEPVFAPIQCEVIELYATAADRTASRAA
jgi:hypothetical protein